MFALLVEAWAGEPGSWADFPAIRAPALIICGENGEPDAVPPRPAGGANTAARFGRGPAWSASPASVQAHRPAVPTAHRIPPRALDVTAAEAGVTHNVRPQAINHASRPAH